jgi:hypothetical protein
VAVRAARHAGVPEEKGGPGHLRGQEVTGPGAGISRGDSLRLLQSEAGALDASLNSGQADRAVESVVGVIINLPTHGYTPGVITKVGEALKPLVSA